MDTNRLHEALAALQRSLAIYEASESNNSPRITPSLNNLGDVQRLLGHPELAEGYYRRAEAILESTGTRPLSLAYSLAGLGGALLDLHRAKEAVAPLEHAAQLRAGNAAPPEDLAQGRFDLARALWESGGDRRRARQLARDALPALSTAGMQAESDKVKTWLASREPPR
jgi:hypothetical protein